MRAPIDALSNAFGYKVATMEEADALFPDKLKAFDQHKRNLIDRLHEGYQLGPKSKPFNREKYWDDLVVIAKLYVGGKLAKNNAISPAERFNRLRQLANAVYRARALTDQAIRQDIGIDLLKAWLTVNKTPLASALSTPIETTNQISEISRSLAKLEAAATAAAYANTSSSDRGRPPILPYDCIQGLARLYRISTDSKPGRGRGPFARFISAFVAAVNEHGFEFDDDSVVGAIQEAHYRHNPSMFDE
jgi:hypothetical protein